MKDKDEINTIVNKYLYDNYFDDFRIVFRPDKRAESSLRSKIFQVKSELYKLETKFEEARLLEEDFCSLDEEVTSALREAEEEFGFFVEANADGFKKATREKVIKNFSGKFKNFIEAING